MKFYKQILSVMCVWNYALVASKLLNEDISDVIESCDYTRFDNKLEKLEYGNILLQQKMVNVHTDLARQKAILNDLERKIKTLPQQIEAMQEKLLQNNRLNINELKDFIRKEIQIQNTMVPPVDDKIILITDVKEKLNKHDQILDNIVRNQYDSQRLLKEINSNNHTQIIGNTISDKLAFVTQMHDKLSALEKSTISRNMLTEVISNQENIKSLVKEINFNNHTQVLSKTIADKLAIMPEIEAKLSNIESSTISKTDHLKFYRDVQQYFYKIDAIKICLKDDNQTLTCTSNTYPTSCADFDATICEDNKCSIINYLYGPKPFVVACNNSVDGGGWTVIQRRIDGSVDFYRNWTEYKTGFGNIEGEFFIGLDKLHALTATLKPIELLIQLQDFENVTKYAKYDDFQVGNETENYKLINVGSYKGDAGDSFSYHKGFNFTTKDRDNDVRNGVNCAKYYTAAWWYANCYESNLNGKYYHDPTELHDAPQGKRGIVWTDFHGLKYSLKSVQMLIRPRKL